MTEQARSVRDIVLGALTAVSGLPESELGDSTPLLDMNLDSLSVVAMLSLIEYRCGTAFDADATAEIIRASDIGGLIQAISRAAAAQPGA